MDYLRRFISVEQISRDNAMGCELDKKPIGQPTGSQLVSGLEQVICPAPRRADRTPCIIDNLNRFCCKPKCNLPVMQGTDAGIEFLDIFLSKDDLDDSCNQMGFFCGSPPVRTNNPLIHDVQFVGQAPSFASPLGGSHGGKPSSRDRAPSCVTPFGGKQPLVRIEGFASGNSESQCIVSALA